MLLALEACSSHVSRKRQGDKRDGYRSHPTARCACALPRCMAEAQCGQTDVLKAGAVLVRPRHFMRRTADAKICTVYPLCRPLGQAFDRAGATCLLSCYEQSDFWRVLSCFACPLPALPPMLTRLPHRSRGDRRRRSVSLHRVGELGRACAADQPRKRECLHPKCAYVSRSGGGS